MATQTVTAEDLGLANAIAETEQEIFSEANGTDPLDNDGDRSLEEMGDGLEGEQIDEPDEGTEEDEAEGEEAEELQTQADDEGEPAQEGPAQDEDRQRPGMVPSGRVREQTERARTAETQLEALRAEFEAFKAGIAQRPAPQPQQPQQPAEPPDMFADPEGFRRHVIEQANQAAQFRHVEASLADAAETHGEKFQAAYRELQTLGNSERQQFGNSPSVTRIWNAPNPGKALMSWHAQQSTLKEVGNDPNAWLDKKLEERLNDPDFLAAAVERARGSARQNGAREYAPSGNSRRMPPSLNSQSGSSHQVGDPDLYDPSERSVFDFATR